MEKESNKAIPLTMVYKVECFSRGQHITCNAFNSSKTSSENEFAGLPLQVQREIEKVLRDKFQSHKYENFPTIIFPQNNLRKKSCNCTNRKKESSDSSLSNTNDYSTWRHLKRPLRQYRESESSISFTNTYPTALRCACNSNEHRQCETTGLLQNESEAEYAKYNKQGSSQCKNKICNETSGNKMHTRKTGKISEAYEGSEDRMSVANSSNREQCFNTANLYSFQCRNDEAQTDYASTKDFAHNAQLSKDTYFTTRLTCDVYCQTEFCCVDKCTQTDQNKINYFTDAEIKEIQGSATEDLLSIDQETIPTNYSDIEEEEEEEEKNLNDYVNAELLKRPSYSMRFSFEIDDIRDKNIIINEQIETNNGRFLLQPSLDNERENIYNSNEIVQPQKKIFGYNEHTTSSERKAHEEIEFKKRNFNSNKQENNSDDLQQQSSFNSTSRQIKHPNHQTESLPTKEKKKSENYSVVKRRDSYSEDDTIPHDKRKKRKSNVLTLDAREQQTKYHGYKPKQKHRSGNENTSRPTEEKENKVKYSLKNYTNKNSKSSQSYLSHNSVNIENGFNGKDYENEQELQRRIMNSDNYFICAKDKRITAGSHSNSAKHRTDLLYMSHNNQFVLTPNNSSQTSLHPSEKHSQVKYMLTKYKGFKNIYKNKYSKNAH